jgi:hypothetical protein
MLAHFTFADVRQRSPDRVLNRSPTLSPMHNRSPERSRTPAVLNPFSRAGGSSSSAASDEALAHSFILDSVEFGSSSSSSSSSSAASTSAPSDRNRGQDQGQNHQQQQQQQGQRPRLKPLSIPAALTESCDGKSHTVYVIEAHSNGSCWQVRRSNIPLRFARGISIFRPRSSAAFESSKPCRTN